MPSLEQYLSSLEEPRRTEMVTVDTFIRKVVPGLEVTFDGKFVGYGPFHYRYASGREGDTSKICLASQKQYLAIYLCGVDLIAANYAERLPKANLGKCCIRFKRLSDLDSETLAELLRIAETSACEV